MKSIFISFNQAFNDEIVGILEAEGQRGFTMWNEVAGRGSVNGEPHLGNHAWPVMNMAILAVLPDDKVDKVMDALKSKDETAPELGLRAFVWNVERSY